ncbi:cell division protein FtsQ [Polaribacter reichenbachii]|uniref:Cell division protein FtsQ n=1 Tax=Polaribacter reichenbachii TaxID=996801 RepID=A0A1B8TRM2_9FLAO|nr:cell division protein FtsQ [Polaribacter reichenbachii]APZ44950.1 cell division protein FtsQ [Polaribacter reichenbachii]AUC18813.1 cell division protein FtsQ [Polaribacter reichenbachii]OBY62356.1 cell division protein FtsQ [Polaribacter reichenbachii]
MKFKKVLKYVVFLVIIASLGFLYSFSSVRNQQKKVSEIVIEFEDGDNNFLTHAMVNKLLIQNDSSVINQAKSVINLYGLEKQVAKNPYVEKASVFLTIKGTLKSIIKQRTPVARIIADGSSYYVDRQGLKVPLSENYSARVILVSGVEKDEEIKEILPLISKILEDDFLQKEVVGIQKSDASDYKFSVRSGNYKIDFGKLEEVDVKFKKLKAFYNKTFLDKTIQNYKTINVKYHNQVVCTK